MVTERRLGTEENPDIVDQSKQIEIPPEEQTFDEQLAEALEGVTNDGRFKIVLDMSDMEYMSSAGFRALLSSQRVCKRYNRGEIVLAAVPERIQEALELAGFTELFKTYPDAIEAVGSF